MDKIREKEQALQERLEKLNALEKEIKKKEKAIKASDSAKKQVPLRLSPTLYEAISKWADEDFRSVNGQIEFLLSECVKKRMK